MSTSKNTQNTPENKPGMIFSKENYTLTLISLLIIIIGFFVMAGKEGDI